MKEYITIINDNLKDFNMELQLKANANWIPFKYSISSLMEEFDNTDKITVWKDKKIKIFYSCILERTNDLS